jgi:putative CocE/NonD family hydrolase
MGENGRSSSKIVCALSPWKNIVRVATKWPGKELTQAYSLCSNDFEVMKRSSIIAAMAIIAIFLAVVLTNTAGSGDVSSSSRYLTMRDGIKIAVDLYLPKKLKAGERVPTILQQTRYYRAYVLHWPFSIFKDATNASIKRFVENGYAYVAVDVRGSGASFGTRAQEWSPDEVRDGAEIVDWIINQAWSDGKVGATGVSYDGTAAEFLLVNKHPAVKAIVPRFSLFDAYTDIAFPGGIHHRSFTEMWARNNAAMDRNQFGASLGGLDRLAFKGVKPVQEEDGDGRLLAAAILSHAHNYDVHANALALTYRDDVNREGLTIDAMSPSTFHKEIEASGAAIYSYGGWYDGAYPAAAIKRYQAIHTPGSKLLIGPWNHGGNQNVSRFSQSHEQFDEDGEILRFFDYHLKGIENGIENEKPVRYYTMGEEKWKFADSWPPMGAQKLDYYFAAQNSLAPEKPASDQGPDAYSVDNTAGAGNQSRWNSLVYTDNNGFAYPDRDKQDKKLLIYTSAPLNQDVEITGYPIITLFISSTATDGNFFVYLEDVDEARRTNYVTEGMLRAIHRKLSGQPSPDASLTPTRTFMRKDAMPLIPGEVANLTFELLPTSYLFKKGHAIRVALAGADMDHFATRGMWSPTVQVYRDSAHPSSITLPVIPRPTP